MLQLKITTIVQSNQPPRDKLLFNILTITLLLHSKLRIKISKVKTNKEVILPILLKLLQQLHSLKLFKGHNKVTTTHILTVLGLNQHPQEPDLTESNKQLLKSSQVKAVINITRLKLIQTGKMLIILINNHKVLKGNKQHNIQPNKSEIF